MTCQIELYDGRPCGLPVEASGGACCLLHSADPKVKLDSAFAAALTRWPWGDRNLDLAVFPERCCIDARVLRTARDTLTLRRCTIGDLELDVGGSSGVCECAPSIQLLDCAVTSLSLSNISFRDQVRLIRCRIVDELTTENLAIDNLIVQECRIDRVFLQLAASGSVLFLKSELGALEVASEGTVKDLSLRQVASSTFTCNNPSKIGNLSFYGGDRVELNTTFPRAERSDFVGGTFDQCDLSGLDVERIEVVECSLGDANLEQLGVAVSFEIQGNRTIARPTFSSARLDGAQLSGSLSWTGTAKDYLLGADGEQESSLEKVHFHERAEAVLQLVSLERCRLRKCNLALPRLVGVRFPRRKGRYAVYDEISRKSETSTEELQETYRALQSNYEARRENDLAGKFRTAYWDVKRLDGGGFPDGWKWIYRNFSIVALYNWFSRYGESYRRTIAWIAGVVLASALLFVGTGFQASSPLSSEPRRIRYVLAWSTGNGTFLENTGRFVQDAWIALYNSLLVFSLQRQGDFWPTTTLGEVVMFSEQLLAPILVALLVLAIQRRFKQ